MSQVLDASAVLAYLHRETGWEMVREVISEAGISAINWSEVAQKTIQQGLDAETTRALLMDIGLEIAPFTMEQAEIAARLWDKTRGKGLSLADRACLALAIEREVPVMTADRLWKGLKLGVKVRLLR